MLNPSGNQIKTTTTNKNIKLKPNTIAEDAYAYSAYQKPQTYYPFTKPEKTSYTTKEKEYNQYYPEKEQTGYYIQKQNNQYYPQGEYTTYYPIDTPPYNPPYKPNDYYTNYKPEYNPQKPYEAYYTTPKEPKEKETKPMLDLLPKSETLKGYHAVVKMANGDEKIITEKLFRTETEALQYASFLADETPFESIATIEGEGNNYSYQDKKGRLDKFEIKNKQLREKPKYRNDKPQEKGFTIFQMMQKKRRRGE